MRACALTAITLMHRSGLVTIQPASEDPAADASVEAINTVFSSNDEDTFAAAEGLDD
jgi:hypothetical protein